MKAGTIAAAIGGTLAVLEGLLLIVLGSLAGLAENPEGDAARTDGYVVLGLGGVVLAAVFTARRSQLVLTAVCLSTAAVGFLAENALWVLTAPFLLAAAVLALISRRGELRSVSRDTGLLGRPEGASNTDQCGTRRRYPRGEKGRSWSWAALIGALVLYAAAAPTWGFSIFLCPLTLALSAVAWFRSDRDGVFWLAVAANVLLVVGAAAFLYEGL